MQTAACALLLLAGCASAGSGPSDTLGASPADAAAPPVDTPVDPPAAADASPTTTPIRGTGACSNVEIAYLVATPDVVDRGATATLSWDGRMARGCDLQPGNESFGGGPLSWKVSPSSTTEYSLRCFGSACLDAADAPVARVTVTVR
jgi:hypothetical protein